MCFTCWTHWLQELWQLWAGPARSPFLSSHHWTQTEQLCPRVLITERDRDTGHMSEKHSLFVALPRFIVENFTFKILIRHFTRHQPQRNTNHSTSCPSKLLLKLYQTMRCLECGQLVHLYGCECVQCSWDSAVVGLGFFFCIYFFIESNVNVWRSYKMSLHSLRQKPLVIYYQENYPIHGESIVSVSFKTDTCFWGCSSPWWSSG